MNRQLLKRCGLPAGVWLAALVLLPSGGCQTSEQKAQSELKRGIELLDANNYDGAIAAFNEAIKNKPEFPESHFFRALARNAQRQFALAIVDCQDAIRLKPNHAPYVFARGLAYLGDEQYDKATEDFRQVKQLAPGENLVARKADELLQLTAQAKESRSVATSLVTTVVSPTTATAVESSWVQHGLLGRSQFFNDHPVWAVILYLVGHLFGTYFLLGLWLAAIDGVGRYLSDGQKSGIAFAALVIGAASYFVAWGYGYWYLWIFCVIWTLGMGGNMIKTAPNMKRR